MAALYLFIIFIALILNAGMGVLILRRNLRSNLNRNMAIFVLTIVIGLLLEIFILVEEDVGIIHWLFKMLAANVAWMGFFYLQIGFSLIDRPVEKTTRLIVYALTMFFFVLSFSNVFIVGVHPEPWGYYKTVSKGYWVYAAFIESLFIFGLWFLYKAYKEAISIVKRKQLFLVLIGTLIPVLMESLDNFILPFYDIAIFPLAGISTTFTVFFVSQAVFKYNFLAISPLKEEVTKELKTKFQLQGRGCYLVEEWLSQESFELFTSYVFRGSPGLCISPTKPSLIRQKYRLKATPIVWLTQKKSASDVSLLGQVPIGSLVERAEETVIEPAEADKIINTAIEFLNKTTQGIVLLDGVDYLISANGFEITLDILKVLKSRILQGHYPHILILGIDIRTVDDMHLAILEQEFKIYGKRSKFS